MQKIKIIIVGCGDRACVYAKEGFENNFFEIVAAVDPDEVRLQVVRDSFNVPKEMCFKNIEEVLALGKIADCVINGTMDNLHIATAIPFLEKGYNMLLEKPITNNKKDLLALRKIAKENNCKLLICHVLRYTDYYRKIKQLILEGAIGEIVHIETSERVCVAHTSISYIRGKWNNESECGSSMLLAKCCHDLDLVCWFNNITVPKSVVSFGGRNFIIPEKAPENAGSRCLVDCPLVESCMYSAKTIYLDHEFLPWYPWQILGKKYQDVTYDEKYNSLVTNNPHGLCAYKVKSDLVDHQSVMIQFANGSTATHTMLSSSMRPSREIFIQGTAGEIEGSISDGILKLRTFDKESLFFKEQRIYFTETNGENGGHYGGDRGIVQDMFNLISNGKTSISCTDIDDSVYSHLCVYAADKSMKEKTIVDIDNL